MALLRKDDEVGPGHILVALLREGSGVGAQVLIKLGADLAAVERAIR